MSRLSYDYIKEFIEKENGCQLISNEYINSSTNLEIKCSCGNIFFVCWSRFRAENKHQCNECGSRIRSKKVTNYTRLPYENVKGELYNFGYILLDDFYLNANTKMNILNVNTGYKYYTVLKQVRQVKENLVTFGIGNPYRIYNLNKFIENNELNFVVKNYKENNEYVELECGLCKNYWKITFYNFINGSHCCPYCTNIKYPSNVYNLLLEYPDLCDEWDNTRNKNNPKDYLPNSNKKIFWICKKCGNRWEASINNRTSGKGCSKCSYSKNEEYIEYDH